jgi:hypothetical protein
VQLLLDTELLSEVDQRAWSLPVVRFGNLEGKVDDYDPTGGVSQPYVVGIRKRSVGLTCTARTQYSLAAVRVLEDVTLFLEEASPDAVGNGAVRLGGCLGGAVFCG